MTGTREWGAAHTGQSVERVDGVPNAIVGREASGRPRLLDPANGQLYGPPLVRIRPDGSLSSHVPDTISVVEAGGRRVFADAMTWPGKTWLVDSTSGYVTLESEGVVVAGYRSERLEDGSLVLRKDATLAERRSKIWEDVSCRAMRALDRLVQCGTAAQRFQTPGFTDDIEAPGVKTYMKWFGQERITPAVDMGAFVRDGKILVVKDGEAVPVAANDLPALGTDIAPRYRDQISASIMGGSDDFKQILIKDGIDARIPDTREISALLAEHVDTGKSWIVTEADPGQFYMGQLPAEGPVSMSRVDIEQDVLDGLRAPENEQEELAVAMRGSLTANARYRMYPEPVVLERSLEKLESLLAKDRVPDYLLGKGSLFKFATTDMEAIAFAARPRVAFNAHVDARLGWPASLPVDAAVLQANSKFYAEALNKLLKKDAAFSPTDFISRESAGKAVQKLRNLNGGRGSAVAWVRLADGTTEVHYAGFDALETPVVKAASGTPEAKRPRWLSGDRFKEEPYVGAQGLSLPPLAGGSHSTAVASEVSAESKIFSAICRDHPTPGNVVEVKLWVTGNRDPAASFYYQMLTNPGVQLRIHDPASNLLMADVSQMSRITPEAWKAMDKSVLPAGVESAFEDDLAYAGGIPYVYTWKDGHKSYIAWEPDEKTLFSREGEGSSWYIPERYDYKTTQAWQTPTGTEPTLNIGDVASGRDVLVPERLESAKQAIRDGILLPPVVVTSTGNGKYVIVDGNHRLQAARDLGLHQLPYTLSVTAM